MSTSAATAIAWVAVAAMVLGVASCSYGVETTRATLAAQREKECWDRGGRWETMGWMGAWCDVSKSANP